MATTDSSSLIRNFVVLGSTGAGKSSTCNTLYGADGEPFVVGHQEISCTKNLSEHYSDSKKITIFDTPGFGDNRFADKKIERSLRQLNTIYSDTKENSSKQIDAFLMVVRLTPRAQTLRGDLQQFREIFGQEALKSLVLLLIYSDKKPEGGSFLERLNQMEEVNKILQEGKQQESSEDWFCVWDNINPTEGQEKKLFEKIGKLQPFKQSTFAEAEKLGQMKSGMKAKLEEDTEMMWSKTDVGSTLDDVEERREVRSHTYAGDGRDLGKSDLKKVMEVMELKHLEYTAHLHDFLIRNGEMMEKYMTQVHKLEERDPKAEAKEHSQSLIQDFVCKRRKLKRADKEEIVGTALRQGVVEAGKKGGKQGASKGGKVVAEKTVELAKEEIENQVSSKSGCYIF